MRGDSPRAHSDQGQLRRTGGRCCHQGSHFVCQLIFGTRRFGVTQTLDARSNGLDEQLYKFSFVNNQF